MRVLFIFLIPLLLFFSSKADNPEKLIQKLKKPIIVEKNGNLLIEHYDRVNLKEKTYIMFKEFENVLVKTECNMKKGLISVGNFVAICVSVGTGFSQGLFQPVFDKIKTVDWILDKPERKPDFTVSLTFKETGLSVVLSHERGSQNLFIPYEDIVHSKVNP